MTRNLLLSGFCVTLLLAACSNPTTSPGPQPGNRPDALELTSLGNEAGVATLTYFNVADVNNTLLRKAVPISGVTGEQLRSIDYAPDGTLYGLAALEVSDEQTSAALYTIDPISGVATQTTSFTLPFEPDDVRFIPGTSSLRVTQNAGQVNDQQYTTLDVTSGTVAAPSTLGALQDGGGGSFAVATAFDFVDGTMHAVVGNSVNGQRSFFATASAEPPTTLSIREPILKTHLSFIESYVQHNGSHYASLYRRDAPTEAPELISVDATTGDITNLGTFPVSQTALARTPPSTLEELF